ncbi:MAG: hypothetical protein WC211_00630 [Dehalococcoidia bacterium]
MATYRLTDSERDEILEISKPVAMIALHCGNPAANQREMAMSFWRRVSARVGCLVDTIGAGGTRDIRDFTAQPDPSWVAPVVAPAAEPAPECKTFDVVDGVAS